MLLKSYQIFVVWIDLITLSIRVYFGILTSLFLFIFPTRRKNLNTEIAVVVGSSRGVGREIAMKLAAQKSTVICIDIQPADIESVSRSISVDGGTAYYFQCDVTSREQVDDTIARIEREIGAISMLFHCCSLPSPRCVVTNPPSVRQTIDVSVTSYFYVSKFLSNI